MKTHLAVGMLAIALLSACGSSSNDPAPPPPFSEQIQGTWRSCGWNEQMKAYRRLSWSITGSAIGATAEAYVFPTCEGIPDAAASYPGTVVFGASQGAPFGAGGPTVTAYALDVSLNGKTTYNLAYVDLSSSPQKLYRGMFDADHDGSTPAKRPVVIDTLPYAKAPSTTAPVISTFTATPTSIGAGASSTLVWSVTGATSLSINQGVGTVTGTSRPVTPAATTSYTLTATGEGGSTTATVTVAVVPAAPVISSFTATPSSIGAGASSTLAWSVTGATSLSIDQGIGTVTGASRAVSPTVDTTYTLTATGPGGSAQRSVSVAVTPFVTYLDQLQGSWGYCAWNDTYGAYALLSFTISGTRLSRDVGLYAFDTCSGEPIGYEYSEGTVSIGDPVSVPFGPGGPPVTAYAFDYTAAGTTYHDLAFIDPTSSPRTLFIGLADALHDESTPASRPVVIDSSSPYTRRFLPPIIYSFKATPTSVAAGGSSTLLWDASGATTVSIDHGVGVVTGGSVTVTPGTSTLYTLTASNPDGSVTSFAAVTVNAATPAFEVACSGSNCGAASPTTYSGTGVGVWRYSNRTASASTIDLAIGGVSAGKKATLLFSNGSEAATTLPGSGTLAMPPLAAPGSQLRVPGLTQRDVRIAAHDALALRRQRTIEQSLALLRATPPSPAARRKAPTVLPTPVVGDTRTWVDTTPYVPVPYPTVARVVCPLPSGRNAVIWVDPAAVTSGKVNDGDVSYFEQLFCGATGGYSRVTDLLGDVWGTRRASDYPSLLIQDSPSAKLDVHVAIVNEDGSGGWAGYFAPVNCFLRSSNLGTAISNEALVFFISATQVKASRPYAGSAVVHELTHMTNYYQLNLVSLRLDEMWLDEMLAVMTEDIVTPVVAPDGYWVSPWEVSGLLGTGGAISLLNWQYGQHSSYAVATSFGAFLNRQYGLSIYAGTRGCSAGLTGYACIDSLIQAAGGAGFADAYGRMGASLFALLPATGIPSGYGIPRVTTGDYTLGALDLPLLQDYLPATATPLGTDFPNTSQTYQVDTIAAGKTTYQRTGVVVPPGTDLYLVIK